LGHADRAAHALAEERPLAALLEVQDLCLSLGGKRILRGVRMTVQSGEVHALVGPNGAGKSSVAYALMGLSGYEPESGSICLEGGSLEGLSVHERARMGLSLAWQEPARFEGLAVREFLRAGASGGGDETLRKALNEVALDPDAYLDRLVDKGLSGGERKRIELASILVMKPRLIVADEPDSGIDVDALSRMFALFDSLRAQGTTVLLVTHSVEVMKHADRATLICCGQTVEEGPAERIRRYFTDRCIPCPYHDPREVEET
jgi:Fe-S cluster assembly ATP-binding protein